MSQRLLADTCAAIKLLSLGNTLFQKGVLPSGSLILHPCVFRETKKWGSEKKAKYQQELADMNKIGLTAGIQQTDRKSESTRKLIEATRDQKELVVGRADIDQLISAVRLGLDIVTNDGPFTDLAIEFEVNVLTAEQILIEAVSVGAITKVQAQDALNKWFQNLEKAPTKDDLQALATTGLKWL